MSWSGVPSPIIENILEHLGWCRRISGSFRLVCKDWQSSHDSLVPTLHPRDALRNTKALQDTFPQLKELYLTLAHPSIIAQFSLSIENWHRVLAGLSQLTLLSLNGFNIYQAYSLISQNFPSENVITLTSLDVATCSHKEAVPLSCLTQLTSITSLRLQPGTFRDDGVYARNNMVAFPTALTHLDLSRHSGIGTISCEAVGVLTRLTYLKLNGCYSIDDQCMYSLRHLKALTYLNLSFTKITDEGFNIVTKLTSLTSLYARYCTNMTDDSMEAFGKLTNLKQLHLGSCPELTGEGFSSLRSLSSLEVLELRMCRGLRDVGLSALPHIPQLRELSLERCNRLTAEGLVNLSALPSIQSLDVTLCTSVSDDTLKSLSSGATALTNLCLSRCSGITDEGLVYVGKITTLVRLDLTGCCNLANNIIVLSGLHSLEELILSKCFSITDEGLMSLASLGSLRTLAVEKNGGNITTKGWKAFCDAKRPELLVSVGSGRPQSRRTTQARN